MEWRINDQVMVKNKTNRSGPLTKEVRVGQITAFADENTAVVTLSGTGGKTEKKEFPLDQLHAVPHTTLRRPHVGF